MNERIREIESQAWDQVNRTDGLVRTDDFNQKFAELLIAAVMAEVRDEVQYEYGWTLADAITERVKKEFGAAP